MLKKVTLLISIFQAVSVFSQTPGLIYKPASTALGRSVLDPNGDGFISVTNTGFVGGVDFGTASEMHLIPMPIMEGEPHSDLTTGANGGHTDLVSNTNPIQTSYIGIRTVNGVQYLVVRIRLGGASTASKGYSLLIDTDGVFGTFTGNNPGFEKEVILETGNNGKVAIYNLTPGQSTAVLSNSYNVHEHHQRSIAASTVNNNADYFYDFFVPLNDLGISTAQMIRFTAATITSAQSGISGTVSDFNGIDDVKYGNNRTLLMNQIINNFPAASLDQLSDPNFTFALPKTPAPVVNEGLTPSSNSISGSSTEANGTVITVFKNGIQLGSTVTVINNTWTLTGVSGLVVGDLITADALATNKSLSDISNTVAVALATIPSCYTPQPIINTVSNSGNITCNITWTVPPGSTFTANSVRILVYQQTGINTFVHVFASGGEFQYYPTSGTMTYNLGGNGNYTGTLVAVAIWNGCSSGYGPTAKFQNSSANTTNLSTPPTVVTNPINVTVGAQNIVVTNNHPANAVLTLYSNGNLIGTSGVISAGQNAVFSVSGLSDGDRITARAQGQATGNVISNLSNEVIVGDTQQNSPTQAPTITGTYNAGSGVTITGTSLEPAGTVITIYRNGILIGTVTVSPFGTWELTGQTLAANDVLTAFAKATGKAISPVSNSVTVLGVPPSPPTVTGSYTVGNTAISGTNGNTLVRVYVDDVLLGTSTPSSGNWTLSGIDPAELYRGAVIHATNVVGGAESANSNSVTVTGAASFLITRPDGTPLGTVVSGDEISIRIKAKDNLDGGGNDFTAFIDNVTLSATITILDGSGPTDNFSSGILGSNPGEKNITIGGVGSNRKVLVVNPNDPSAFGEADIEVIPALWRGRNNQSLEIDNKGHNKPENWTHNRVPASGANVKFADDAVEDMEIEANYIWNELDFSNLQYNVILKDNNLRLNAITNRNGNEFKTLGLGSLIMDVAPGQSNVFYVANSNSNYLTVQNPLNSGQDVLTFSVRVFDDFLTNGVSGSTVPLADRVNLTWIISNNNPGVNSSVDLIFEWLPSQESNADMSYELYHYENNFWGIEGPVSVTTLNGIRYGTVSYSGTFSPFAIGSPSALPVEFLGMLVSCESDYVNVQWSTASEYNASHFAIETSSNGLNWSSAATVNAAGTTSQLSKYAQRLRITPGVAYYRIVQYDFDGQSETFVPVYHECSESGNRLIAYPNPASSNVQILIQTEENLDNAELEILDMFGRVIFKMPVTVESGSNAIQLDIEPFSSGVYLVRLKNTQSDFQIFKFIKE